MKNILLSTLLLGGSLFFMSGCSAGPKPLYNYENYSQSYYNYKKDLTPESQLNLEKSIEEAINNRQDSSSGRVPPGLYANLGYIYLKGGNSKKAIENFNKEKEIYPEAAYFMDKMIQKVKVAEGKNNEN